MTAPLAAVDLGTQSCLLLIGRRGPGGLEVDLDRCELPRLGEGLERTGEISSEALERVEEVLGGYLREALKLGCKELVVGGTAALRRASNRKEVIRRLAAIEADGLRPRVELISEVDEARYGWLAAAGGEPSTCVLDVGGGSTEVVAAGGELMRSAPLGAAVLTERLGEKGWEAMLDEARSVLAALSTGADELDATARWVALGGTATNLASLALGLEHFDHLAVEGATIATSQAAFWGAHLDGLTLEERCQLPIEPGRAAVLPAGFACMAAALEAFGPETFGITGRGLRYGFLSALLEIR